MECTNIAKTHSRAWGAAISVIAISLVGAVAVGRLLSNPHADTADTPAVAPSGARFGTDQHPGAGAAGQAAHDSHCASCGTVASIREVWVEDDATGTGAIAG